MTTGMTISSTSSAARVANANVAAGAARENSEKRVRQKSAAPHDTRGCVEKASIGAISLTAPGAAPPFAFALPTHL